MTTEMKPLKMDDVETPDHKDPLARFLKIVGFLAFLLLTLLTPLGIYVNKVMGHVENGLMVIIQIMGILITPFSLMLIYIIFNRKMNKLWLIFPILLLILSNALFVFIAKTRLALTDIIKKAGTVVPDVKNEDLYIFDEEIPENLEFEPEKVKKETGFDCRVRWPGCITDVQNQGQCGNCWSFATTAILSDLLNIKKFKETLKIDEPVPLPEDQKIELSPQYLVECWNGYEGIGKCISGETVTNAAKLGKEIGSVSKECKPDKTHTWDSGTDLCDTRPCFDDCSAKCMDGKDADVKKFKDVNKLSGTDSLKNNILRIKNSLMDNGPVLAGMILYDNFPNSIYSGIYQGPKEDSKKVGGHAVRIVGWGTNEEIGEYWVVANSWSQTWGLINDPGYFYIKMGVCSIENYVWEGKL